MGARAPSMPRFRSPPSSKRPSPARRSRREPGPSTCMCAARWAREPRAGDVAAALEAIRSACPGVPVGVSTGAWIVEDAPRRLTLVRSWEALPGYASVNVHEDGAAECCASCSRRSRRRVHAHSARARRRCWRHQLLNLVEMEAVLAGAGRSSRAASRRGPVDLADDRARRRAAATTPEWGSRTR